MLNALSESLMASVSRASALALYRDLMRAASGFHNYNFRDYAMRSVRDGFREGSGLSDSAAAYSAYLDGRQQLEMLRRQASISQMFPQGKHAMESGDATDTDLRYGGHLKDK